VIWPLKQTLRLEVVQLATFGNSEPAFPRGTVVALGSTLFAAGVLSGLLFLAGAVVANWRHAVVAVLGAAVGVALAIHVGAPGDAINSGFVGFNAVLAALAAFVVIDEDLRMSVLAAVLATWIFSAINRSAPFPALASGFVLTIWGLLLIAWINPWFTGSRETTPAAG
jgi:urea transporter